ncbi:hypothetical protein NL676_016125 [Syzygium grande]|nr:hypothetical protein NL676_016125 [Syzygium grande]
MVLLCDIYSKEENKGSQLCRDTSREEATSKAIDDIGVTRTLDFDKSVISLEEKLKTNGIQIKEKWCRFHSKSRELLKDIKPGDRKAARKFKGVSYTTNTTDNASRKRKDTQIAHDFGVSTESMQLSYDSRGNRVPTTLLPMQRKLYSRGGLQAECISRINAENSQEESVRDQLNRGVVPEGIYVHCLAGLIKLDHYCRSSYFFPLCSHISYFMAPIPLITCRMAWFRELPTGVLDPLSPEQVMQCQTQEEFAKIVRVLPSTEAALLDWTINLMADAAQMQHLNKMNAANVVMVFAPNMTQMADPLTALMYAVQVMNFLKMIIVRTLRKERTLRLEPFDESGHQSPSQPCLGDTPQDNEESEQVFAAEEPNTDGCSNSDEKTSISEGELCGHEEVMELDIFNCETEAKMFGTIKTGIQENGRKAGFGQTSETGFEKGTAIMDLHQPAFHVTMPVEE